MTLAQQLAVLETANLEGLRAEWRRRFGAPPKLRSPELLRRIVAWRIQAAALGGVSPQDRRRLRAEGAGPSDHLSPSTRLVREWQGVRHEVEVVGAGFVYGGREWKSLSQIARHITGTRWNGPRFFGLRP